MLILTLMALMISLVMLFCEVSANVVSVLISLFLGMVVLRVTIDHLEYKSRKEQDINRK